MKGLGSEIGTLLSHTEPRREFRSLLRFFIVLAVVIVLFTICFHVLMLREGREYSWVTGLYWTLTVMSTLGFGDITFHSDVGRAFTVVVLLSGIVLLLILLPFVFIRFFYAPWLEQLSQKAPVRVPHTVESHVIISEYDELAAALIERLTTMEIPYVVIEPDRTRACELKQSKIRVISGPLDERCTYAAAGIDRARMLVANVDDVVNANITITARESAEDVSVVATSLDPDAVDVLELAGARQVLALRQELGRHLANRVSAGKSQVHIVGEFRGLAIAEFPFRSTALSGMTLAEARVRERTGVTIAAIATRGNIHQAMPETVLADDCIGVAVAPADRLEALNELLAVEVDTEPVLVIGGGKVGRSAAQSLKERGIPVHIIEENEERRDKLEGLADLVFYGDAADLHTVTAAGIVDAPSVILTTKSDATNIFLAIYCRKLNPSAIIVSRVASDRNIEAIHRAGADFAVSDCTLGVHSILCFMEQRPLVLLGEGLDLFTLEVPPTLAGKTLANTQIRRRTGLQVVAIDQGDTLVGAPTPHDKIHIGERVIVIGTAAQRDTFAKQFG